SVSELAQKFQQYLEEAILDPEMFQSGNVSRFVWQPITDIHLQSHLPFELEPNGNIIYVYIFAIVGVFVLILACINFVNLATARYMNRAEEVSMRKVYGARRTQLMRQFLWETMLYVLLALALALLLAEITLPGVNALAGKHLTASLLTSPFALGLLGILLIVVTLMAGGYPAWVLSTFRPMAALQGQGRSRVHHPWMRNGLVVGQFCIATALLIGTMTVYGQLHYVQEKQLGFDKAHILVVEDARQLGDSYRLFRDRVAALPQVSAASAAHSIPGRPFDAMPFLPEQPSNFQETSLAYTMVDEHFAEVLDLHVVDGRNFSPAFSTDSSAFLINQQAAKVLGWSDPVGKQLDYGYGEGTVVGVVEDFHFESLHEAIRPLVMPYIRWSPGFLMVRLRHGDPQKTIAAVRAIWQDVNPHRPLHTSFLDQDYQRLYDSERRMARLFSIFSGLAILIACVGLFGLAAFAAERRTKEIGIRKVLGATTMQIVTLLNKRFLTLVSLGFVLAIPLAWIALHEWLQHFAYHVALSWWVFALTGGGAILIAVLSVSSQAVKAALTNPAETLRYE
ncbi:MAG TPA: FtsX-like permease family protein, partial [bacterium]|nr:FtsX-like permease family protein [bacterium]